jgi:hypothetical protein
LKVNVTLESEDGKIWVVIKRFFVKGFLESGVEFNEGDILQIAEVK